MSPAHERLVRIVGRGARHFVALSIALAGLAPANSSARDGDDGERAFDLARDFFRAKHFVEAREVWSSVPRESKLFRLAEVYRAVCDFQLDFLDSAELALDPIVDDAARPADEFELRCRSIARTYRAMIAFARAERGLGDWRVAADRFGCVAPPSTEADDPDHIAALAEAHAVVARLRVDDLNSARCAWKDLGERFPDDSWTGWAGVELYKVLHDELETARWSDPPKVPALLREMAESLEIANRAAPNPTFNNLRLESKHWLELGERERARRVLASIVERFRERESSDVERYVIPDLARVELELGFAREAADLLAPLVDAKRAGRESIELFVRALGGWCEFDLDGRLVAERPGVGGAPNFARAMSSIAETLALEDGFTPNWYELEFEGVYVIGLWSRLEPRVRASATSELRRLQSILGDDFVEIDRPALRRRFVWLRDWLR